MSESVFDKKGRVHWAHTGGAPFDDMAFLEKQLGRMNGSAGMSDARSTGVAAAR